MYIVLNIMSVQLNIIFSPCNQHILYQLSIDILDNMAIRIYKATAQP